MEPGAREGDRRPSSRHDLTGFDITVGGAPRARTQRRAGLVGTISIDSPTPIDIVAIIRSLRGVEGVLFADGESVISSEISEGRFAYVLDVQFDQTIYSGAYAADEEGED